MGEEDCQLLIKKGLQWVEVLICFCLKEKNTPFGVILEHR